MTVSQRRRRGPAGLVALCVLVLSLGIGLVGWGAAASLGTDPFSGLVAVLPATPAPGLPAPSPAGRVVGAQPAVTTSDLPLPLVAAGIAATPRPPTVNVITQPQAPAIDFTLIDATAVAIETRGPLPPTAVPSPAATETIGAVLPTPAGPPNTGAGGLPAPQTAAAGAVRPLGNFAYALPLPGKWTYMPHLDESAAVDIPAAYGTPIFAVTSGQTSVAVDNAGGNRVYLRGDDGLYYAYLHLAATGYTGRVTAGQHVGYVGTTGYSTGPHLHFAISDRPGPTGWGDFAYGRLGGSGTIYPQPFLDALQRATGTLGPLPLVAANQNATAVARSGQPLATAQPAPVVVVAAPATATPRAVTVAGSGTALPGATAASAAGATANAGAAATVAANATAAILPTVGPVGSAAVAAASIPVGRSGLSKMGVGVYQSGGPQLDALKRMNPGVIVLLEPDANFARSVRAAFPKAFIVGRRFFISQPLDDPSRRGREAADFVAQQAVPLKGVIDAWMGYNEVLDNGDFAAYRSYDTFQVEFAKRLQGTHGIPAVAANNAPGAIEPDDYVKYFSASIKESKYFGLHAYAPKGATNLNAEASWYMLRYRRIHDALSRAGVAHGPMIITESGPLEGWRGKVSWEGMADQFAWYTKELEKDSYMIGHAIFGIFGNGQWAEFDLAPNRDDSKILDRLATFSPAP